MCEWEILRRLRAERRCYRLAKECYETIEKLDRMKRDLKAFKEAQTA